MFGMLLNTSAVGDWMGNSTLLIGAIFVVILIAAHPDLSRPDVRRRLGIVLTLLIVIVVPATVLAVDLFAPCDWEEILNWCSGSYGCAYAYWYWAGCPVR